MKKIASLLALLLLASPALAADNGVVVTNGAGVTMKSKDVGAGVQALQPIVSDATGTPYGTTANPFLTGAPATAYLDGWDVTQGTKADAAWVSGSGSVVAILKNIAGGVAGSIPAGTAIIGKVGIDQTTPGTTNLVAAGQNGTWTVQPGNTQNTTPWLVKPNDGTNSVVFDPCKTATKTSLPITITTASVKVIATGASAKKTYICHIFLTSAAADNVAVFEATTATVCATSPIAMIGAGTSVATAGNGMNFSANGGVSLGNGDSQVAQTTVNNNDICLGTSAATVLTGVITYAQQ
jgi:hypothetical protein